MARIADAAFKRGFKFGKAASFFILLSSMVATAQALPRQATDSDVKSCRFLSRVSGDSGYGKNNDWKGLAKYAALRRAEKLGASDVVWERFTPVGSFNGMADGKVYDCNSYVPTQASVANNAKEEGRP